MLKLSSTSSTLAMYASANSCKLQVLATQTTVLHKAKTIYTCKNQAMDHHAIAAGVYLHGSVGSGKSLLMDMFYRVITEHKLVPNRRRMHFNAAMLEV